MAAFGDFVSNSDHWMHKKISMEDLAGDQGTSTDLTFLKKSKCWLLDKQTGRSRKTSRFYLVLAPLSRYQNISFEVRQFFTNELPDNMRHTLIQFFLTEEGKGDWSTKALYICGYRNDGKTVFSVEPSTSPEEDCDVPPRPSKEIVSALVFSHNAGDGCFVHMASSTKMSIRRAKDIFSGEDDSSWDCAYRSDDDKDSDECRFYGNGFIRYLLHIAQCCTVFDPANENSRLWACVADSNKCFFTRLGFRDNQGLPASFGMYLDESRTPALCENLIEPFEDSNDTPMNPDPFWRRGGKPLRKTDMWGVSRTGEECHCFIASIVLALSHSFDRFDGSWNFRSSAEKERETTIVEHQQRLRKAFVDVTSLFRNRGRCARLLSFGVRQEFDNFLNHLETIPRNILLDEPFTPEQGFSTNEQEDVLPFMHFLLNTMQLVTVFVGWHERTRFVPSQYNPNDDGDKSKVVDCDYKPALMHSYSIMVYPNPEGSMSDCIQAELFTHGFHDDDHEKGLRSQYPDVPNDYSFQQYKILQCSKHNVDETTGMPARLIVYNSQGTPVRKEQKKGKKSEKEDEVQLEMDSTPIAKYVETIHLDALVCRQTLEDNPDAAHNWRRSWLNMYLKGFVHYRPDDGGMEKNTGHYICFVYQSHDSWLVYDDDEVFHVTSHFAHQFATTARVWLYEQPTHGGWYPSIPVYQNVGTDLSARRNEFFSRCEEVHKDLWWRQTNSLEYLAMVLHIVHSKKTSSVPSRGVLENFMKSYIVGPPIYVSLYVLEFYKSRISAKQKSGRSLVFLDRFKRFNTMGARDVLMSFARARVCHYKKFIDALCKEGASACHYYDYDKEPTNNSSKRIGRLIQPKSERMRTMILKDIKESFFIPDNKPPTPFSDGFKKIVDQVISVYSKDDNVRSAATVLKSSPQNAGVATERTDGTITPDIVSLASDDEADEDRKPFHYFQSDFRWRTRFQDADPCSPKCSTLIREFTETEQLWILMLRFFSDGTLSDSNNGKTVAPTFIGYQWSHPVYRSHNFRGSVDYSSVDRIFKDEYLSGDQGSHYINLLQQRQMKLEAMDPNHPRILFLDCRLMDYLECNMDEGANSILKNRMPRDYKLAEYNSIMILCNVRKVHYYWIKVCARDMDFKLQVFDSLSGSSHASLHILTKYLRKKLGLSNNHKGAKKKFLTVNYVECPQQGNTIDCLLFCLLTMDFHSYGYALSMEELPGDDMSISTRIIQQCRPISALSLISCSLMTELNMVYPRIPEPWLRKVDDIIDFYQRNSFPEGVKIPLDSSQNEWMSQNEWIRHLIKTQRTRENLSITDLTSEEEAAQADEAQADEGQKQSATTSDGGASGQGGNSVTNKDGSTVTAASTDDGNKEGGASVAAATTVTQDDPTMEGQTDAEQEGLSATTESGAAGENASSAEGGAATPDASEGQTDPPDDPAKEKEGATATTENGAAGENASSAEGGAATPDASEGQTVPPDDPTKEKEGATATTDSGAARRECIECRGRSSQDSRWSCKGKGAARHIATKSWGGVFGDGCPGRSLLPGE